LHEDENVIVLSFGNHVLTEYLDERVNFEKFDDGKVVNYLSSWEFYGVAVETLEHVGELVDLNMAVLTLKFSLIERTTMLAVKFLLK
jgi:hypothetical protein